MTTCHNGGRGVGVWDRPRTKRAIEWGLRGLRRGAHVRVEACGQETGQDIGAQILRPDRCRLKCTSFVLATNEEICWCADGAYF